MRKAIPALLTVGLLTALAASAVAAPSVTRPVQARARASQQVVVATVASIQAAYETNQWGDRLIVTRARLQVHEALKGSPAGEIEVDIEGGTVADITLTVSDLPVVKPGERAVFFVARNSRGRLVPHLRRDSILKLDALDRVEGSSLRLGDVRAQVLAAR